MSTATILESPTSKCTIYLTSERQSSTQRAHFGLFIPDTDTDPAAGTFINAVGAPMAGYHLECKYKYRPAIDTVHAQQEMFPIGEIDAKLVQHQPGSKEGTECPRSEIEGLARRVPTPKKNENFMAVVNDVSNGHCRLDGVVDDLDWLIMVLMRLRTEDARSGRWSSYGILFSAVVSIRRQFRLYNLSETLLLMALVCVTSDAI